jgi:hypothetical protein
MKKYYATVALGLGAMATTMAQTLTDQSNSIQVGDVFTVHVAPYLSPGSGGADVTWDFSGLAQGTILTYSHVDPAVTGYAASFPASNVAQQLSSGEILFVQTDGSGMQQWGEVINSEVHVYTDAERIMSYPCSYGTAWADEFTGTYTVSGMQWVRTGAISATVDGYGSLVMPYGTLDNVLRIHAVQTIQDEFDGGSQQTLFNIDYFYRVGVRFPVVTVIDGLVTTDLGSFPVQSLSWIDEGTVGMADALQQSIGVQLFPNPAHAQVNVVFTSDGSTATTMQVIDASGRTVYQRGLGQRMAGIQLETIDVGAFAPGVYSLCITDGKGGRGVQRLVVE